VDFLEKIKLLLTASLQSTPFCLPGRRKGRSFRYIYVQSTDLRQSLLSLRVMTLIQSRTVSLSSSDLIKMEERKRPAPHDHDNTEPPLKRQATTVNGAPKGHIDADMPWKDDLEVSKSCDF